MKVKILFGTFLVALLFNIVATTGLANAQIAPVNPSASSIARSGFWQVAPADQEPDWAEIARKQELVERVESYRLVTYDEYYNAVLGRSASSLLGETEVAEVREMVAEYNALPLLERRGERIFTGEEQFTAGSTAFEAGSTSCTPQIKLKAYWWGVQTYMNSCFIKALQKGLDNKVVKDALAWLQDKGKAGKIAAAVLSIYFKVYSGWLNSADDSCGQKGAYLRAPWALLVLAWVKKVC